jgi:hypothetical protein
MYCLCHSIYNKHIMSKRSCNDLCNEPSKKPKIDDVCESPVKNGSFCECGNIEHEREYKCFVTFVSKYNEVCASKIDVSERSYNNRFERIFIKYATDNKLLDDVFNKGLTDQSVYKYIGVDVVLDGKRIFRFNNLHVNDGSCLDFLHDFVPYCNYVKLFDGWFDQWIDNGSGKRHESVKQYYEM